MGKQKKTVQPDETQLDINPNDSSTTEVAAQETIEELTDMSSENQSDETNQLDINPNDSSTTEVAAQETIDEPTDMSSENQPDDSDAQVVNDLMTRCRSSILYENSRGEFFTDLNLAMNSENSDRTKVKTHKKQ